MQELDVTWNRLIRIWWLFFWRGAVGGFAFGFVAGFIIGLIAGVLGLGPMEKVRLFAGIAGYIAALVWSAFVLRMALKNHYSDFRIALVLAEPRRAEFMSAQPTPPHSPASSTSRR